MFILKLYDREGNELNEGDIVKISNRHKFNFFAEVKYIEKEQIVTPFHTFSFHSFIKVDKVPEGAKLSTQENRYKIWYMYDKEAEIDKDVDQFDKYLSDWRQCEHFLQDRCFRIKKVFQQQTLF